MEKADYQSIAPTYDHGRPITEGNLNLWLEPVAKRVQSASSRSRLVDFGCGTGRFALPLAYRYGIEVTAVDSSAAMLAEGRRKDREGKIRWQQADVEKDEWPAESFDAVFMSHLLHHLDDPAAFLARCFSMLRPGGSIFVRYGALEHVLKDPIHEFFPRTKDLDAARTPSRF
jgi:ubiquinone/menaquinone biosynthesis C-methylase UbiE